MTSAPKNTLPTDRPTEAEILNEVRSRGDSVTAKVLMKAFADQGYSAAKVQRAIQRALDTGALELGQGLRLTSKRRLAAA
jgi:hypothetical protein